MLRQLFSLFKEICLPSTKCIKNKYSNSKKLCVLGGSAGGLTVTASMNMQPKLFQSVVAAVPFVDVISTMLDKNIPLTTNEYHEWGNPNIKKY